MSRFPIREMCIKDFSLKQMNSLICGLSGNQYFWFRFTVQYSLKIICLQSIKCTNTELLKLIRKIVTDVPDSLSISIKQYN